MASIRDLWTKPNPDKTSNKRIPGARWGKGKRWQVRWEESGKPVSQTFTSHDAALTFKARVEVGQADGTWINKDKRDITLADLWEPWIASKAGTSEKTRRDYESIWRTHIAPVWGHRCCCEIQRGMVAAWIPTITTMKGVTRGGKPRPVSASAMRKAGIIIHSMMDLAVELKVIPANPVRTGDLPKQKKSERRYLKVDEIDRLLEQAPHEQARLMLTVLLMTGLRPGEAKGLKVKDLDVVRGRLMIRRDVDDLGRVDQTKTRDHRDVPIGGELLHQLAAAAEGRDMEAWLLPDEKGNVWTTARWRVVWKNLQVWCGLEGVDTYELRHTAASLAIAAGADVKTVQRMLGHASAAMTLDVYGHLWEEGLDQLPGAMEKQLESQRVASAAADAELAAAEARRRRAGFRVV